MRLCSYCAPMLFTRTTRNKMKYNDETTMTLNTNEHRLETQRKENKTTTYLFNCSKIILYVFAII